MNATKLVVAAVTAVSVFGVIGLAYAQSTSSAAPPSNPDMQRPSVPSTQGAPMDPTMPNSRVNNGNMNSPATGTMDSPATGAIDGSGNQTSRAARADRN